MQMVTRSCFGVPNIREFLWSPVGANLAYLIPEAHGKPATVVVLDVEDGSVLDAVKALPENYRNAIYLHYYEGYTTAEIGRMLKVPTNTVLSWLRRARAQLQTMLKEEIEDEVV